VKRGGIDVVDVLDGLSLLDGFGVLDSIDVTPITVVVCGLRRAKELLSLRRETTNAQTGRMVHVRLTDGLSSVLGLLGRHVDRGSLLSNTSLLGLFILLFLVVVFDDTTDSGNCILTAQGHEGKTNFVRGVRNHCYVVDRLWNSVENSRRYASKYTFPGRVRRPLCHRDNEVLWFSKRAAGGGVAAEDVPRGSWRSRARAGRRSGKVGRQWFPEDLART
jgi:hypothetical protein